jgi:formylglycine-generating enzyme required for sulfatase activity
MVPRHAAHVDVNPRRRSRVERARPAFFAGCACENEGFVMDFGAMKLSVLPSALTLGALGALLAIEAPSAAVAAPPKGLMGEAGLAPKFGSSAEPSASDKETARALFESGDKAFKEKRFAEARKDFEAAYALVPVPSTGAALARTLAELGQLVEARDVFLAVQRMPATKGEPAPFTKARKEATDRGKELADRIPTIRLSIEGLAAGTALQVFFDGAEIPAAAATAPRKVNPGRHAIVVKAAGYVDQVVTATVGERGTTELSVTLVKGGDSGASAGVVCPASTLWDGKQCVSANVACPVGTKWSGQACVPLDLPIAPPDPMKPAGAPQCPAGTVLVAGATFNMGSSDPADDEKPAHPVTVGAFCMDRAEVTVDAYAKCVASGKCVEAGSDPACNGSSRPNHPVNCVSAKQALEYCASVGKRLPSEEEWELAARGAAGRKYPWGDAIPSAQVCWQREKSEGTCEVGATQGGATPEGIVDLTGNVLEWTSSKPCSYADPNLCKEGRVVRGGSWYAAQPSGLRTTRRWDWPEFSRLPILGFRCAAASK